MTGPALPPRSGSRTSCLCFPSVCAGSRSNSRRPSPHSPIRICRSPAKCQTLATTGVRASASHSAARRAFAGASPRLRHVLRPRSNGPLDDRAHPDRITNGDLNFFVRPTDNLNAGGAPPFPYVLPASRSTWSSLERSSSRPIPQPRDSPGRRRYRRIAARPLVFTASAMLSLGRRLPISSTPTSIRASIPEPLPMPSSTAPAKAPSRPRRSPFPFTQLAFCPATLGNAGPPQCELSADHGGLHPRQLHL